MSSLTTTVKELSEPELTTASCPTPRSLAISEHSLMKGTPQAIRAWLMSSQGVSPVSHSVTQANSLEQMIPATCGLALLTPFASYDHATASWKTSQLSLLTLISEPFSETWPKAGIACAGAAYRLRKWEHRITEIGSGYIPTPRANEHGDYQYDQGDHSKPRPTLTGWVKMWPTPAAHDIRRGKGAQKRDGHAQPLTDVVGGQLSPVWVEWLMGWPIGWTDLKPLAMDKYQQWLEPHGIY